jgi:GntR family transcriptional regulator
MGTLPSMPALTPPAVPEKREPAYLKIERHLRRLLSAGGGINEALPSEVGLAQTFGVSIMTVRQAYTQLVNAGLVRRVPFRGTWAVPRITDDVGQSTGRQYPESWRQQASSMRAEVLALELRPAPDHIAGRFRVDPQSELLFLERRRWVEDKPLSLDFRWMPAAMHGRVAEPDFAEDAVFAVMERVGFPARLMQSDLTAALADERDADLLNLNEGAPVLIRDSTAIDHSGATLLVSISRYAGERYTFRSSTPVNSQGGSSTDS